MLNPTLCCEKGIHIVETRESDTVMRCVWCGQGRRIAQPTGNETIQSLSKTVGERESLRQPVGCCDSLTRQANYPRPTITERKDDLATEAPRVEASAYYIDALERVFKEFAREFARNSPLLQQWVASGNKLPAVYQ